MHSVCSKPSFIQPFLSTVFVLRSILSFLFCIIYEALFSRCCPCLSSSSRKISTLRPSSSSTNKKTDQVIAGKTNRGKVAVIGGGIAGTGCAWALAQDDFEVHLFESAPTVGGNAKTYVWPDGQRTGLSVLAWPEEYFNNYQALLSRLKITHSNVQLGFHIQNPMGEDYIQGNMKASPLYRKHMSSVAGWERMVSFVRAVNRVFNCCPKRKSLYRMNMLNPLNVVPLRWLSIPFGVTRECWDDIIVPMYASTFLTVQLDMVPSIILPIISDIIPLKTPAVLRSWDQNSTCVFDAMLTQVQQVHLNEPVTAVEQDPTTFLWSINGTHHGYDRVVFASNAKNVRECPKVLPNWLRVLFQNITYTMETDDSMIVGDVHSDSNIFPFPNGSGGNGSGGTGTSSGTTKESLLASSANFIQARRDAVTGDMKYTNTFILNSWIPSLEGQRALPRLVTYGAPKGNKGSEVGPNRSKVLDQVYNHWNHPHLTTVILGAQYLLRYIQGRNGVYFCGSLATPGNGHDLSFCSGMAVACAIGAKYPFEKESKCVDDFVLLKSLMGL